MTRSRPRRHLAAATAAAALTATAAPAHAAFDPDTHIPWNYGLSLGLSFGQRTFFVFGLDLVATPLTTDAAAFGGSASAQLVGFEHLRLAVGPAGTFLPEQGSPQVPVITEVGYAFRSADFGGRTPDPVGLSHGVHGAVEASAMAFGLRLGGTLPFAGDDRGAELTLALVVRPLGFERMFRATVIEGRPLRMDDPAAQAHYLVARRDGPALVDLTRLDPVERAALADRWFDAGCHEHESIASFLGLARDLAAAGAPRDLVAAAHASARDEVRHAALSFDLAGAYGGLRVTPRPTALPPAMTGDRIARLARLAAESFTDGALGEGAAAARAQASHARAADPAVAATLGAIARDEQGHADLAWRVIAFCLAEGGQPVRDALAEAVAQAPEAAATAARLETAATAAHGQAPAAQVADAFDATRARAVRRARALLDRA